MKVLFITNIPSPYRVDFFNELGKMCELTVVFEKASSDERNEEWKQYKFANFKGIILNGKSVSVDKAFSLKIIRYVKDKSFDHIICANCLTPTGMLAVMYMKYKYIVYWLESDGAFAKTGKGFKEHIKKYLITGAKGYFSTSEEHDRYYLQYGARKEQIYRYPFTSIKEADLLPPFLDENEKKSYLHEGLDVCEEKMVLAVGQFIYRKGFDLLLKAAQYLPDDIGIYIVGGEPSNEFIELKKQFDLNNVHFVGFKTKRELKKYYMAADLFVHPTREDIWGLVINEAMACGLPVITTNKCTAGLELVKNGENGYIIPINDSETLGKRICTILNDVELQSKMGKNSLLKIREYTIEQMAKRHMEILGQFGSGR